MYYLKGGMILITFLGTIYLGLADDHSECNHWGLLSGACRGWYSRKKN
jgi:hypothetical protein